MGMAIGSQTIKQGTLADFLRAKRAQLKPDEVGLPPGRRRRTPGLRREELADLAGVGVSWYTALEQGRDINPSDQLLRSLANALKLNAAEAHHLFFLAGRHPTIESPKTLSIGPGLRAIVEKMSPQPALIANQRWDWLVWNDAVEYLFERDPELDPSVPRNTLLETFNGKRRISEADWEAYASLLVGRLRASPHISAQHEWFEDIVQRLLEDSPEFKRIWDRYEVADVTEPTQFVHHSELGRVPFEVVTLLIPTHADAWLVVFLTDQDMADRIEERLVAKRAKPAAPRGKLKKS